MKGKNSEPVSDELTRANSSGKKKRKGPQQALGTRTLTHERIRMNPEKKRNEKKPKSVQSEHQKKMKEEGFGLDQLKSEGEDPNPNPRTIPHP